MGPGAARRLVPRECAAQAGSAARCRESRPRGGVGGSAAACGTANAAPQFDARRGARQQPRELGRCAAREQQLRGTPARRPLGVAPERRLERRAAAAVERALRRIAARRLRQVALARVLPRQPEHRLEHRVAQRGAPHRRHERRGEAEGEHARALRGRQRGESTRRDARVQLLRQVSLGRVKQPRRACPLGEGDHRRRSPGREAVPQPELAELLQPRQLEALTCRDNRHQLLVREAVAQRVRVDEGQHRAEWAR